MKENQVSKFLKSGKCLIIAEIAQAHDGSLGTAHAYIDAAAKAGADAIKFQTHIAEEESTPLDQWRVKFSKQDATRMDYWRRMEFTDEQWAGLKQHADEKGLIFLSSPFSNKAVDLLESLDMPAWKIASGELTNLPMIEKIMETKKPILISSGMSELEEVDALVSLVKKNNIELGVFQCTSAYPTPPEKVGINMLDFYRKRYGSYVGLSDHSGSIYPSLAGVALGMNMLEIHITFSKEMFGPDVVASITIEELKQLSDGVRYIETMIANPIEKDLMADSLKPMKGLFQKSIVAAREIKEGEVLSYHDLAFKKPGHGISANQYKELIGKKLNKDISYNHFFNIEDFN